MSAYDLMGSSHLPLLENQRWWRGFHHACSLGPLSAQRSTFNAIESLQPWITYEPDVTYEGNED